MKKFKLIFLALFLCLFCLLGLITYNYAYGQLNVTIEWKARDPNFNDTDVDGYYIWYSLGGTGEPPYDTKIDVGNILGEKKTYQITGLPQSELYFFAIQPYKDSNGWEFTDPLRLYWDFTPDPNEYSHSSEVLFDANEIIAIDANYMISPSDPKEIFLARKKLIVPDGAILTIDFFGAIKQEGRAPISFVLKNSSGKTLDEKVVYLNHTPEHYIKKLIKEGVDKGNELDVYMYFTQKAIYVLARLHFFVCEPYIDPVTNLDMSSSGS